MEHRSKLELRQISRTDRVGYLPLHVDRFPVSARFVGAGRTRRPVSSESYRLLHNVYCDVRVRYHPNGVPRSDLAARLVSSLRRTLRTVGWGRAGGTAPRLQS